MRALARIKHLPWTLDLAGDGPLEARLRSQAAELGIAGRVQFLGFCSDPAALLREAQIFALISRSEAFPYGILEAMRAGLPVLASAVGGVSEAVAESSTGLLAAPGDEVQLAAHLERLVSEPALRKQLGDNGRRRFLEQFTFDRMLAGTLEVYREATQTAAPLARPQPQN